MKLRRPHETQCLKFFVTQTRSQLFTLTRSGGECAADFIRSRKASNKGKNVMSNADPRGTFVWHELLTSDAAGAGAFYPKVVSWKPQAWEKDASYTLWMTQGGPIG